MVMLPASHHSSDIASKGKCGELPIVHAVFAKMANVDLDTGVILCLDQLIGPRAASIRPVSLTS